ncbi:family 1 glycosylhydrolase [Mycobacterium sp. URHB0021]
MATAAHQVEGNNVGSDVWLMEHLPGTVYREPSGDATDFYHRYPDDIAVIAALGLNAFRFGIEWARIEPEDGKISNAALDHYSRVVDTCLRHGIEPVLTLHHFTSPQWLIRHNGGWRGLDTAQRFADYAATVLSRLGDRVRWVCTINEANVPALITSSGLLPGSWKTKLDETMRSPPGLSGSTRTTSVRSCRRPATRRRSPSSDRRTDWPSMPFTPSHRARGWA